MTRPTGSSGRAPASRSTTAVRRSRWCRPSSLRDWDRRRFRINLIVDGINEDGLTGEIAIGGAVISIRRPIERCVMVTRAQPGIERDLSVLKTIIAERGNTLGIGGTVATPGPIAVGDEVLSR